MFQHGTTKEARRVYDVLYMAYRNGQPQRSVLAQGLDRDRACELARDEARRRNAGRMFLAGSEPHAIGDVVLIVESGRTPTAA
jgi:hypothetical protein